MEKTKISSYKHTIFLLILSGLAMFSCSRQNTTMMGRTYHNMTSLFNYYYNAEELFTLTVKELEREYEFDGLGFIDIIYYGDEENPKYETEFADAIKKNDILIFKHPHSNFIDNCRFLNGKLRFYKHEYRLAMQNFDEVLNNFTEFEDIYEVYFWKAKAYYMMDNVALAKDVLAEFITENPAYTPKGRLQGDVAIFQAQLAIEEGDNENAISLLEENMKRIKGFERRARSHYLLGQLYEQEEDYARSLVQFQKVKRHTNDYDFIFQSKIKIAELMVDYQAGEDDDKKIYKYLKKLARDEKNEEFLDQVYFQSARLELKKDSLMPALDYLQQSIQASVRNNRQKAISYYKVGDIYFYEFQHYPKASAYYDSAAQVIPSRAPEYTEYTRVAKTMQKYIRAKETIAFQDSMLWLASLPEDQLNAYVDSVYEAEQQRIAEEQARLEAEAAANKNNANSNNDLYRLNQLNQFNQQRTPGNNSNSQGWYFDDPSTVISGKIEFERKWGKRTNEDHWRRSNKAAGFGDDYGDDTNIADAGADSSMVQQYGDKASFYQTIPRTEDEIANTNMKIEEAYYSLGQIYSQNLNEPDSAIKTFEEMLDRYDNSEFSLRARYALYKLYTQRDNPLANAQKSLILNEYPNSIYSYLIQGLDPEDFKEEEAEFIFAYEGLYKAYRQRQFITSLGFSEFLLDEYIDKPGLDQARMEYIRGMSYGFVGLTDSLEAILTKVTLEYPNSDVKTPADETLALLRAGFTGAPEKVSESSGFPEQINIETPANTSLSPTADTTDAGTSDKGAIDPRFEGFTADIKPNDKLFVLMFIPKDKIAKNELRNLLTEYNEQAQGGENLKAFVFDYHQTHLVPYINSFPDTETAQSYIDAFLSSDLGQQILDNDTHPIFYSTQSNFRVSYSNKRMEDYVAFYREVLRE